MINSTQISNSSDIPDDAMDDSGFYLSQIFNSPRAKFLQDIKSFKSKKNKKNKFSTGPKFLQKTVGQTLLLSKSNIVEDTPESEVTIDNHSTYKSEFESPTLNNRFGTDTSSYIQREEDFWRYEYEENIIDVNLSIIGKFIQKKFFAEENSGLEFSRDEDGDLKQEDGEEVKIHEEKKGNLKGILKRKTEPSLKKGKEKSMKNYSKTKTVNFSEKVSVKLISKKKLINKSSNWSWR